MKRKVLKRGLLFLLLVLCFILTAGPVFAEEQRVYDYSGLFTAEETAAMETRISELRQAYEADFVILTSDDTEGKESLSYAEDFYDYSDANFGVGDEYTGILYFIDMDNRVPTISTTGYMIDYITDDRLNTLLDEVYYCLADGEFARSVTVFLDLTEQYLREPVPENQYRYDEETGEIYEGNVGVVVAVRTRGITPGEIGLGVVIAAIAFLIFQLVIRRKYNLKGSTYYYNQAGNSQMNITGRQDLYLHTTETRRRIQSSSGGPRIGGGGGSGVHRGSSGRSHGGGSGRRF